VSKKLMGNFNVAPRVNGVFEENEPNNPMARNCTPQFNSERVKESSMGSMGIFRQAHVSIAGIHITCNLEPKLIPKKEVKHARIILHLHRQIFAVMMCFTVRW
jgi:hypothetical protein